MAEPVARALIEPGAEPKESRPRRRKLRESAGLGLVHAGLRVLGRDGAVVPIRRGDEALVLMSYRAIDGESRS